MKSKIQNILNKTHFFKLITSNKCSKYILEKPSQILIRNIYINWLQYLNLKTHKSMLIYVYNTQSGLQKTTKDLPFGVINKQEFDFKDKYLEAYNNCLGNTRDLLELKLVIPQQDYMQYFVQWQRYRKYWWSSITTTPSLFTIGDIKQNENDAEADIVAKFPCGLETVEKIKIEKNYSEIKDSACLSCLLDLDQALLILLIDGLSDDPKDDYLRLHRKIAPYKMSFAINYEDLKNKGTLKSLAALLFHRLNLEKVPAQLPEFSLPLEEQICQNLRMGIPYTAILDETTLQNGIFCLMNSSTLLKEQIHVADFHKYAGLICNAK